MRKEEENEKNGEDKKDGGEGINIKDEVKF